MANESGYEKQVNVHIVNSSVSPSIIVPSTSNNSPNIRYSQDILDTVKFNQRPVLVNNPFSVKESCPHLFSPLESRFLGESCNLCYYLNSFIDIVDKDSGLLSFSTLAELGGVPEVVIFERWVKFYLSQNDDLSSCVVPYMSSLGSLPHFHGAAFASSSSNFEWSSFSFHSVNFTDSCLADGTSAPECPVSKLAGLAYSHSEGGSCTSASLGCAKCGAAAYLNGYGGSLFSFVILSFFNVGFNVNTHRVFLRNPNFNVTVELTNEAVLFLYRSVPHLLSFACRKYVEEVILLQDDMISGSPQVPSYPRPRGPKPVLDVPLLDHLGFNPCACRGGNHAWVFSYPGAELLIEFGTMSFLIDYFVFGTRMLGSKQHALRVADFGRLRGFNPRINYELALSMLKRADLDSFAPSEWRAVPTGSAQGERSLVRSLSASARAARRNRIQKRKKCKRKAVLKCMAKNSPKKKMSHLWQAFKKKWDTENWSRTFTGSAQADDGVPRRRRSRGKLRVLQRVIKDGTWCEKIALDLNKPPLYRTLKLWNYKRRWQRRSNGAPVPFHLDGMPLIGVAQKDIEEDEFDEAYEHELRHTDEEAGFGYSDESDGPQEFEDDYTEEEGDDDRANSECAPTDSYSEEFSPRNLTVLGGDFHDELESIGAHSEEVVITRRSDDASSSGVRIELLPLKTSAPASIGKLLESSLNFTSAVHETCELPLKAAHNSLMRFAHWLKGKNSEDLNGEAAVENIQEFLKCFKRCMIELTSRVELLNHDQSEMWKTILRSFEMLAADFDIISERFALYDENFEKLNAILSSGRLPSKTLIERDFVALSTALHDLQKDMKRGFAAQVSADEVTEALDQMEQRFNERYQALEKKLDMSREPMRPARQNPLLKVDKKDDGLQDTARLRDPVIEGDRGQPIIHKESLELRGFRQGDKQEVTNTPADIESASIIPKEGVVVARNKMSSVQDILSSRFFVGQTEWKVGDKVLSVLTSLAFPKVLFKDNAWFSSYYKLFQYFTCESLEIEITCTSDIFQGGILALRWDSLGSANRMAVTDGFSLSNLPGGEITAGGSSTYRLNVPFDSIQEQLSLSGYEAGILSLGCLVMYPVCGLTAPAGSSNTAYLDVYAQFKGAEFRLRTMPHAYPKGISNHTQGGGLGGVRGSHGHVLSAVNENVVHHARWETGSQGRLFSLVCHPCAVKKTNGTLVPTSLAMISSNYQFWRGTLLYRFYFGGNAVTRGKLHIVSLPGSYLEEEPTGRELLNLDGVVVDLGEKTKMVTVTVPFNGIAKFQRVSRYMLFDSQVYGQDIVTRLHVVVVDPLTTNTGSVSGIDVVVTAMPGNDFELQTVTGLRIGRPLMVPFKTGSEASVQGESSTFYTVGTGGNEDFFFGAGGSPQELNSYGYLFEETIKVEKCAKMKVAPSYCKSYIAQNLLTWVSSLHLRWSGDLDFRFEAFDHEKVKQKVIHFRTIPEDLDKEEFSIVPNIVPPTGAPVLSWDMNVSSSFELTVRYTSRFASLMIPRPYYKDVERHPSFYYGSTLCLTPESDTDLKIRCKVRAGKNFRMYGRAPLPHVVNKKGDDVYLEYFSSLSDITATPKSGKSLKEASYLVSGANSRIARFKDGDVLADRIALTGSKQMDWEKIKTGMSKVGDKVGSAGKGAAKGAVRVAGKLAEPSTGGINLPGLYEKVRFLSELDVSKLDGLKDVDVSSVNTLMSSLGQTIAALSESIPDVKKMTGDGVELVENMTEISGFGAQVIRLLKSLIKESFPGWVMAMQEEGKMTLVIVVSLLLIVAVVLWWRVKKNLSMLTNATLVIMAIWSPFIGLKCIDLYNWLTGDFRDMLESWFPEVLKKVGPENGEECLNEDLAGHGSAQFDWESVKANPQVLVALSGFGVVLTSLFVLHKMPSKKVVEGFTEKFNQLGEKARALTSIGGMVRQVMVWHKEIVTPLMTFVLGTVDPTDVDSALTMAVGFKVSDWMSRVCELNLEENKFVDVNSDEKVAEIRKLYDQGIAISSYMVGKSLPATVVGVVRETFKKCESLVNETYTNRGLGQARVDPIHICQFGDPGIGKSTATTALAHDLGDFLGFPKKDRIYARCTADAFWSRYSGQPIVVYDDLGGVVGDPSFSDYGEFINLKSNNPHSLNMASVQEKGSLFRSHVIISNTNIMWLDNNTNVRKPDAFYRRRNIFVDVERVGPFNPESPCDGLRYSVIDTFTADLRREWDWFCEGWMKPGDAVDMVTYEEFLVFIREYSRRYLDNQHKVVSYLRSRETPIVEPTVEEVVKEAEAEATKREKRPLSSCGIEAMKKVRTESGSQASTSGSKAEDPQEDWFWGPKMGTAQGDDLEYDLDSLVRIYNGAGYSGKDLAASLDAKGVYVEALFSTQSTDIKDHLIALCVDSHFDMDSVRRLWRGCEITSKVTSHRDGKWFVRLERVPKSQLGFVVLLSCLEAVWSPSAFCCTCSLASRIDLLGGDDTVTEFFDAEEFENLDPYTGACWTGSQCHFEWEGVNSLFPDIMVKFGIVAVTDGEKVWSLGPINSGVSVETARTIMRRLESTVLARDMSRLISNLSGTDLTYLRSLIRSKSSQEGGDRDEWLVARDTNLENALPMLVLLCECAERSQEKMLQERKKNREREVAAIKGLKDRQQAMWDKLFAKCSPWMKKTMAIGGAILGAGALVGIGYGVYKLFGGGGKDSEEESTDPEETCEFGIPGEFQNDKKYSKQEEYKSKLRIQRTQRIPRKLQADKRYDPQERYRSKQKTKVIQRGPEVSPLVKLNSYRGFAQGQQSLKVSLKEGVDIADVKVAQPGSHPVIARRIREWQRNFVDKSKVCQAEWIRNHDIRFGEKYNFDLARIRGAYILMTKKDVEPVSRVFDEEVLLPRADAEDEILALKASNAENREGLRELVKSGDLGPGRVQEIELGPLVTEFRDKNIESLIPVYERNCAQLYFTRPKLRISCLFVAGSRLIMPAHYLDLIDDGDEMVVVYYHGAVRVVYDARRSVLLNGMQDLVLIDCGPKCPTMPDIQNHFLTLKEYANYYRGPGFMMNVNYSRRGSKVFMEYLKEVKEIAANTEVPSIDYTVGDSDQKSDYTHYIVTGFKYPVYSVNGHCGSVILADNQKLRKKILGMHVAASEEYCIGYCEALTKEGIEDAMLLMDKKCQSKVIKGVAQLHVPVCEESRQCVRTPKLPCIRRLAPEEIPRTPVKTSIRKSRICGLVGPVLTEPTILTPYDTRLGKNRCKWDPLIDAVEKYGERVGMFDKALIGRVEEFLKEHVKSFTCVRPDGPGLLTDEQAINGIPETNYLPLTMGTSAGYPYVLRKDPNDKGKRWLFEECEPYSNGQLKWKIKDEELREKFVMRQVHARRGERYPTQTMEIPKDERRKLSKIYDTPATRSFTCMPTDYNLVCRKYFLDFAVAVQEARSESFCKVGINPCSMEWSFMMDKWKEKGAFGFAGDYSRFDGIGPPEIYESITRVVNSWYGDGEEMGLARQVLLSECYHRETILRDMLVQIDQGMPSGFPMTVIYNSFCNFYFLAMAWISLVGESDLWKYASVESFWEFCSVATYGDDNVVSVNKEFLDVYNLQTVSLWLSQYGIGYVDDQKRPIQESEPYVPIENVTFLKRSFVPKYGIWCAPLNKVSIEEQCNWIKECDDPIDALNTNVKNALFEARIHGKEYYDEFRARLETAYAEVFVEFPLCTEKELLVRWWFAHFNERIAEQEIFKMLEDGLLGSSVNWETRLRTQLECVENLGDLLAHCWEADPIPLGFLDESPKTTHPISCQSDEVVEFSLA